MKYRAGFVTNSSSSCYTLLTVNFVNGKSAAIGRYDYSILEHCEKLFDAIDSIGSIKAIDKIAAYLIDAFDYLVPHSQESENLASFIGGLTIDKTDEEMDAFVGAFRQNAKSMEDISQIVVNDYITITGGFSDYFYITDAVKRIAEENGIDSLDNISDSVYSVIRDAMYNSDSPHTRTLYTFDIIKKEKHHKTDLYIDDGGWSDYSKPIIRIDKAKHFYSVFNPESGEYYRSGIIKGGKDSGIDPFMASFPHLLDVGIMGHCSHGQSGFCKVGCYQSGSELTGPNMTLEDFESIARQCAGKVDQFALGGRGDPDMHENFVEILKTCNDYGIVSNFTTSGFGLTEETARACLDCGAVAVSWYGEYYTTRAIELLLDIKGNYDRAPKVNIHYVLGSNTIDDAIERLECDYFPEGINSVIFLLHKPVGHGRRDDVLQIGDPRVRRFFELIDKGSYPFKIGIDSCTVPGIFNFCENIAPETVDTCEAARFSAYIDADMMMTPCSFDRSNEYAVSLREYSIEDVWNSFKFESFRDSLRSVCNGCKDKEACMGGCPLMHGIVLCNRPERRVRATRT